MAVRRQFVTGGPAIRAMVESVVGYLVYGGGLYVRKQTTAALNRTNEILFRYIIDFLETEEWRNDLSSPLHPDSSGTSSRLDPRKKGVLCGGPQSRKVTATSCDRS